MQQAPRQAAAVLKPAAAVAQAQAMATVLAAQAESRARLMVTMLKVGRAAEEVALPKQKARAKEKARDKGGANVNEQAPSPLATRTQSS